MSTKRINPKEQIAYGYYNYGSLWGIERLRRDAIKKVETLLGKDWKDVQDFMEIHKVKVTKI